MPPQLSSLQFTTTEEAQRKVNTDKRAFFSKGNCFPKDIHFEMNVSFLLYNETYL